jgi:hypothetical protein
MARMRASMQAVVARARRHGQRLAAADRNNCNIGSPFSWHVPH